MKQKIVVKVSVSVQKSRSKALKILGVVNVHKSRSKALQIAVGILGVEWAALGGNDESQIEIVGDGVDAVELITLLRKKIGHTEIVSVSAVGGEKKPEEKKELAPKVQQIASVPQMVVVRAQDRCFSNINPQSKVDLHPTTAGSSSSAL